MTDSSGMVLRWLVLSGGMVVVFTLGLAYGDSMGMVRVASGQYACELVADADKTTHWECAERNGK